MQDHDCPYLRDIIALQQNIPGNFPEQWGRMQQKVEQIHDALYSNGYSNRLRRVELDLRWVIASVSVVLLTYGAIIGFVIYLK